VYFEKKLKFISKSRFATKFAEILASQGLPPVSTTPAANFATSFPIAVDTGGK
jgi:hypothetical protein